MADDKQADQGGKAQGGESPGSEPRKPAAETPQPDAPKKPEAAPAKAADAGDKPVAKKPVETKPPKKPAVMETTPWEDELTSLLQQEFGDQILEFSTYVRQNFLVAKPESVVPIIEFLKLEAEFDYLVDVTAVDYPKRDERFDLVYVLYSHPRAERIRVKTMIKEDFHPESCVGVHLTANWLEREVYDMFGIEFANHPDLKRILMPDDWEGWPLRKDKDILDMDNKWVKDNLGIESGQ